MNAAAADNRAPDEAGHVQLRRELVHEVRALVVGLVETAPPDEALAELVAKARDLNHEIATFADSADGDGLLGQRWRYYSPFRGELNPLAPPIVITQVAATDDPADGSATDVVVEGRVRVSGSGEGPPGAVHGGVLSGLFDEVLGAASAASGGKSGVTARLEVRYRRPTPLNRDLVFCGWVTEDRGWRRTATARCMVDGETTAQATALFVVPQAARP